MSKNYDEEEIVAIVEECLRGNFKSVAFKYSIKEYKLYRWCRKFRRPSFSTRKKLSELKELAAILGNKGRSQENVKYLEREIIDTDIITFRSMLELDHFYLNYDISLPFSLCKKHLRLRVGSILRYLNTANTDTASVEKYVFEESYPVFNHQLADKAFWNSIMYLTKAMYLFDCGEEELELCRESLEIAKKHWLEVENLIDIEAALMRRKNYAGANKTKENASEARKKLEEQEKELLELIKSEIGKLTKKEAFELRGSARRQGDLIAKRIHSAVIGKKLSDKEKRYDLSKLKELSSYILEILINNKTVSSLYLEQCEKETASTPSDHTAT